MCHNQPEDPPPPPKANPIPSSLPPPHAHQWRWEAKLAHYKTINGLNPEGRPTVVDIEGMKKLRQEMIDANLHTAPPPKPPAPPPPTEVRESPPPQAAPPPFANTDTTNTWQDSDSANSFQIYDTQADSQDNPSQSTVGWMMNDER